MPIHMDNMSWENGEQSLQSGEKVNKRPKSLEARKKEFLDYLVL
jgi:hypothetical protein